MTVSVNEYYQMQLVESLLKNGMAYPEDREQIAKKLEIEVSGLVIIMMLKERYDKYMATGNRGLLYRS